MKVLNARIRWFEEYDNFPSIELLVDEIPDRDSLRYTETPIDESSTLYVAEKNGLVSFFLHYSRDETGYGGSVFSLTLTDGTVRKVKGPWSSNGSFVNSQKVLPELVMEVALTDNPMAFARGYTFSSSAVTLSVLKDAMEFVPDAELVFFTGYSHDAQLSAEQTAVVSAGLPSGDIPKSISISFTRKGYTFKQSQVLKRMYRILRSLKSPWNRNPEDRKRILEVTAELAQKNGLEGEAADYLAFIEKAA